MKIVYIAMEGKERFAFDRNQQVIFYTSSTLIDFTLENTLEFIREFMKNNMKKKVETATQDNYKIICQEIMDEVLCKIRLFYDSCNDILRIYSVPKNKNLKFSELTSIIPKDHPIIQLIIASHYDTYFYKNMDDYKTLSHYLIVIDVITGMLTNIKDKFCKDDYIYEGEGEIILQEGTKNRITIRKKSTIEKFVLAVMHCIKQVRQVRWLSWFENYLYGLLDNTIKNYIELFKPDADTKYVIAFPEFFFVDFYDRWGDTRPDRSNYAKPFYEDAAKYFAGLNSDFNVPFFLEETFKHKRLCELTTQSPIIIFAGTMLWKTNEEHTVFTDGKVVIPEMQEGYTAVTTDTYYNTAVIFASGRAYFKWDKQFISQVDKTEGIKVIKKHVVPPEPVSDYTDIIRSTLNTEFDAPYFIWRTDNTELSFLLSICLDLSKFKDVNIYQPNIHMIIAYNASLKPEYFKGNYLSLCCDGTGNGRLICLDVQSGRFISGIMIKNHFVVFESNPNTESLPQYKAANKTHIPPKGENSFYEKVAREGLTYEDQTDAAALFSDEEEDSINLMRNVTTQVSISDFNEDCSDGILKITSADYEKEYNIVVYPFKDDTEQQYIKAELKKNNTPFELSEVFVFTANASSDLLSKINISLEPPKEFVFYFYENDYREYNISFDINEKIDLIEDLISFESAQLKIERRDDLYRYILSAYIDICDFNLEFGIVSGILDIIQVYIKPAAPNTSFPGFAQFADWLFKGDLDVFKSIDDINLLDLAVTNVNAYLKAGEKIEFTEFIIGTRITLFSLVFYIDIRLYDKTISGFLDAGESKSILDVISGIFTSSKIQIPKPLENICIDKAIFSTDFINKTYSIDFSVNGVWDCGIFQIDNLEMIIENSKNIKSVMFMGRIILFEEIETDVSVYSNDGVWELRGFVSITDNKSLYDLFKSFDWNCPYIFKNISLEHIGIFYTEASDQNKFTFDCGASVTINSLIMDFSITAEKSDSEAVYKGEMSVGVKAGDETNMLDTVFTVEFDEGAEKNILSVEWKQESKLNITEFCHALGFEEFELPDFINITITGLSGTFDFDSNMYLFTASTSSGDVIYIRSELINNKREFIFGVSISADLSMRGLPVVGQSVDVLDKIHIKDMKALILTSDYNNLTIQEMEISDLSLDKGLYILSDLMLIDKVIPINIPIASQHRVSDNSTSEEGKELTIDINKNLGPFSLRKIGASYSDKTVWFLMYASFDANSLSFALDDLGIGYKIAEKKPDFMLKGLSVDVKTSALTIGGSFIKSDEHTYKGSLLIGLSFLNITAFGAYTSDEIDSVFAFALLKADIGGPPCFFITGLAMGFGYNRNLEVPEIDELDSFPLLKAAGGEISAEQIFNDEKTYFPPEKGENWITAGIMFNSFKMVDSAALLTFKFGSTTEIDLIGKSVVDIPYNDTNPIGHAALLLKASIKPETGLAAIEGALSNDCYILSKDCHLTGSFAFYTWYSGEHSGDFVLTLGGYKRNYEKPDHYPSAQRLGLNWNISSNLSAQGELYFALTPSCIMAGGALKLQFTTSCVEAWFDAALDIYIQWKPYYYEFDVGILIGVKVKLKLFTVKVEIGCNLSIWGPEFGGIAHVKLWIISFSIPFGNSGKPEKPSIDVKEFISSFLPQANSEQGLTENDSAAYGGCVISVNKGLIKEFDIDDKEKGWKICAENFEILAKSVVPAKNAVFILCDDVVHNYSSSVDTYLRPCNDSEFDSELCVTLKRTDGVEIENKFAVSEITENLPSALWAKSTDGNETVSVQTGLMIRSVAEEYYEFLFEEDFQKFNISMNYSTPHAIKCKKYDESKSFEYISKINREPVVNRNEILKCLGEEFQNVSIDMLAEDPGAVFSEKPLIKTIGGV